MSLHRRVRSLSDPITLSDTHLKDTGLKPNLYYSSQLNPINSALRSIFLPLLKLELPIIKWIQHFHSPWLDLYFLHTANLGSHTFYVLCLPIFAWFGSIDLFRDIVFVLGFGIYVSGFVKDSLCLPRPKSPPVKRLTLSTYTSKEYGCPSSHTANATGACLIFLYHIYNGSLTFPDFLPTSSILLILVWYWLSLVIGRIYCGMHGLVDVSTGAIIGIFVTFMRILSTKYWDHFIIFSFSPYVPIVLFVVYYSYIIIHPVPVDDCPCFEDSLAFVGVMFGLDLAHYFVANTPLRNQNPLYPVTVGFDYNQLGLGLTILRILVGVLMVVSWKELSKPIIVMLLPLDKTQPCFALKGRTSNDIWVKLIVYAGVPIAVVVGTKVVFPLLGIDVVV